MTLFVDIDGTVLTHGEHGLFKQFGLPKILQGVKEFFVWVQRNGHYVVLTTGRKECMREDTVRQLRTYCIAYDALIMGLPPGERIVINDAKSNGNPTAYGCTVKRNVGLKAE